MITPLNAKQQQEADARHRHRQRMKYGVTRPDGTHIPAEQYAADIAEWQERQMQRAEQELAEFYAQREQERRWKEDQ